MITPIDYKSTYLHSRDNHSLKQDLRFYLSKRLGFHMRYSAWEIDSFGSRNGSLWVEGYIRDTVHDSLMLSIFNSINPHRVIVHDILSFI